MIYVLFSRKPHKTKQHVYHYNTTHAIPVAVCCSQLDEIFSEEASTYHNFRFETFLIQTKNSQLY